MSYYNPFLDCVVKDFSETEKNEHKQEQEETLTEHSNIRLSIKEQTDTEIQNSVDIKLPSVYISSSSHEHEHEHEHEPKHVDEEYEPKFSIVSDESDPSESPPIHLKTTQPKDFNISHAKKLIGANIQSHEEYLHQYNQMIYSKKQVDSHYFKKIYQTEVEWDTINKITLLHRYTSETYNYGFIYTYYRCMFPYNIPKMYEIAGQLDMNEQEKSIRTTRDIIVRKPKMKKEYIVICSAHLKSANDIQYLQSNIQYLSNIAEKIIVTYSVESGFNTNVFVNTEYVTFIREQINNHLYKYYIGLKSVSNLTTNRYVIFFDSELMILYNIHKVTNFFMNISNDIISYTDGYEYINKRMEYKIDSRFMIMTSNGVDTFVFYLKHMCNTSIRENEMVYYIKFIQTIGLFPVSYISVDDFLPYYHRSFERVDFGGSHAFLLFRKDSSIISTHSESQLLDFLPNTSNKTFLTEYLKNENIIRNFRNELKVKICILVQIHSGEYLKKMFDTLQDVMCSIEGTSKLHFVFATCKKDIVCQLERMFSKKIKIHTCNIFLVQNESSVVNYLKMYYKYIYKNTTKYDYIFRFEYNWDKLQFDDSSNVFKMMMLRLVLIAKKNGLICSGNDVDVISSSHIDKSLIDRLSIVLPENIKVCVSNVYLIDTYLIDNFFEKNNINVFKEIGILEKNNSLEMSWNYIISGVVCYIANKKILGV